MSKLKLFLAGIVLVLTSACYLPENRKTTEPTTVEDPTPIVCHSKLERSLDFSYYPQNATQYASSNYQVKIYVIDTIEGKQIALNSLELQNYDCLPSSR